VLFSLSPDEGGWPPYRAEEVDGTLLSDGVVLIESPPAFARGVAVGDTVSVTRDPEGLWAVAGLTRSEHSTLRIMGRHGNTADTPAAIAQAHGCSVCPTPIDIMVTVDVPPEWCPPEWCA